MRHRVIQPKGIGTTSNREPAWNTATRHPSPTWVPGLAAPPSAQGTWYPPPPWVTNHTRVTDIPATEPLTTTTVAFWAHNRRCPRCTSAFTTLQGWRRHIYATHRDGLGTEETQKAEKFIEGKRQNNKVQQKRQKLKAQAQREKARITDKEATDRKACQQTEANRTRTLGLLRHFYREIVPEWTALAMATLDARGGIIWQPKFSAPFQTGVLSTQGGPQVTCDTEGCRNVIYGGMTEVRTPEIGDSVRDYWEGKEHDPAQIEGQYYHGLVTSVDATGRVTISYEDGQENTEEPGQVDTYHCTACVDMRNLLDQKGKRRLITVVPREAWQQVFDATEEARPETQTQGLTLEGTTPSLQRPRLEGHSEREMVTALPELAKTTLDQTIKPFGLVSGHSNRGNLNMTPRSGIGCHEGEAIAKTFDFVDSDTYGSFNLPADLPSPVSAQEVTLILITKEAGHTPAHVDPALAYNDLRLGNPFWITIDIRMLSIQQVIALTVKDNACRLPTVAQNRAGFAAFAHQHFEQLQQVLPEELRAGLRITQQKVGVTIRVLPHTWHTVLTQGPALKVARDYCTLELAAEIVQAERTYTSIRQKLIEQEKHLPGWGEEGPEFVRLDWYLTQSLLANTTGAP